MNTNPSPSSYRVLLIEEDRILAEALELCLEYMGIETTHIAPGEKLRTTINAQCPDVIVLDFNFNEKTRQRILADLTNRWPIPVIALITRYDHADNELTFISQYVTKPFGFQELARTIDQAIQTRVAAV